MSVLDVTLGSQRSAFKDGKSVKVSVGTKLCVIFSYPISIVSTLLMGLTKDHT
jgi:hypothetical protein